MTNESHSRESAQSVPFFGTPINPWMCHNWLHHKNIDPFRHLLGRNVWIHPMPSPASQLGHSTVVTIHWQTPNKASNLRDAGKSHKINSHSPLRKTSGASLWILKGGVSLWCASHYLSLVGCSCPFLFSLPNLSELYPWRPPRWMASSWTNPCM